MYDSIREIAASPGLRLVGLRCALPPRASAADVRSAVHESVLLMERFHVDCDIVLTQLVLEESEEDLGVRSVPLQHRHDLLEMVDDALESDCERTRFPRPTLTLMADVYSRVGSGAGSAEFRSSIVIARTDRRGRRMSSILVDTAQGYA
ncbi:hypothetical protein P9209_20285 [Prescottella defluvii]|nr:hypothetical protein P9209_20285 [Prescottella defluvii]